MLQTWCGSGSSSQLEFGYRRVWGLSVFSFQDRKPGSAGGAVLPWGTMRCRDLPPRAISPSCSQGNFPIETWIWVIKSHNGKQLHKVLRVLWIRIFKLNVVQQLLVSNCCNCPLYILTKRDPLQIEKVNGCIGSPFRAEPKFASFSSSLQSWPEVSLLIPCWSHLLCIKGLWVWNAPLHVGTQLPFPEPDCQQAAPSAESCGFLRQGGCRAESRPLHALPKTNKARIKGKELRWSCCKAKHLHGQVLGGFGNDSNKILQSEENQKTVGRAQQCSLPCWDNWSSYHWLGGTELDVLLKILSLVFLEYPCLDIYGICSFALVSMFC